MKLRGAGPALLLLTVLPAALFLGQAIFPRLGLYAADGYAEVAFALGSTVKPLLLLLAASWAWACTRRFEKDNPIRPGWWRLGLGLTLLLCGQLVLAFYQLVVRVPIPFPSAADVLFVIAYPLLVAALVAFLRAYEEAGFPTGHRGERRLMGAIATLLCAFVAVPVLSPVLAAEAPVVEKVLNLLYPILDFVLLIPTVILLRLTLRFRGGPVGRIWLLLLLGFVFLCVGDVLFSYLSTLGQAALDPLVDAMYVLSYGSLAAGALLQLRILAD
jgi:hypothetical protein